MKKTKNKLSLPRIAVAIITLIVFCTACIAVNLFSNISLKNFSDYAQKTAEKLSYEASSIIKATQDEKTIFLEAVASASIHNNKNIMVVEFADKNGQTFITKKSRYYNPSAFTGVKVNTPVNVVNDDKLQTAGYVKIFVSNESALEQIHTQKIWLSLLFFVVWLTFLVVIFLYKLLLDRELKILYLGLKNIVDGKFGTKITISGNKQTNNLINIFNDLSLKLQKYEEQNVGSLLIERNKLEAILMSIVNGVVVCDNADNIVLMNSAAEKMLNVATGVLNGVAIQCYTDSDGKYCFRDKIEEFKDTLVQDITKNPPEFTISVDNRIIRCILSPIFMQNDEYLGYIIVMLDVTKETEVNNMKNQFISNVSHELRTPVTVLRTYIDTLYSMGDELDKETRKEFTATANKEVTRLHRMVNDILDVSRLESPDVELEKEITDIAPIIEDTVTSMQVLADEKDVKIVFTKPDEPVMVPINVANMERVFNNLISNAIKYSPEKTRIEVMLSKTENYAEVSVTDHGCGIEEKHLAKLFDRFYRVENSVHTVKGTGLGLYLVKTTVEKHHNGKVYVTSKVGEGSTFGIKLPLSL
ncbi:MAG: PAS domain-containing protein [Candidatus Gastranaerophilales bacterium]|nr:PAS domain-containing protein [Candidatus Gastranaerophilales bacterium]